MRCAGSATTATFTRTSFVTENASCDKTNNGGRGEGIARARGFGPGDGVERRGEVREKRSAHLRGLRTMWSALVRRVRCALRDETSAFFLSRSARNLARVGRGERTRSPEVSVSVTPSSRPWRFFFFWFSQSDLFDERQTRERETLPGVSGATAGVGCVREDEPAEQGAEG